MKRNMKKILGVTLAACMAATSLAGCSGSPGKQTTAGPNGAGKSTAINMITGLLPLTEGEIYHEGTKISGMSAHQIAQTRCSRTFQNLKLYRSMTVKENLMMGSMMDMKQGFFPFMFNFGAAQREEKRYRGIQRY